MHLYYLCHWPGTHLEMWKERNHLGFCCHQSRYQMHLLHILEVMIKCSDVQDRTARSYQNMIQELVNHKCSPLLQRFPAQHMESRAHRFRLLRQGMQAPRASLQNSSAIQSSSSVHTPDCYSLKTKEACHTSIEIQNVKLTWAQLLPWRTERLLRTGFTCKVSTGILCPIPPEGEVRGLGLTVSEPLLPEAPGKFLMALEFMRTVPA